MTNSLGDTASVPVTVEVTAGDPNPARIMLTEYLIYLPAGSSYAPMDYVAGVGDSDSKSGRYRDLTWKQAGISGAKPGMLAFMGVGTGDVNHTGLVTERGTVLHSSKSRGCVVETELTEKRGWNGLGKHRMIAVDGEETADSAEGESVTVCAQGGLRMRKKPKGRYMQMIPDGAQLAVLEEKDGWLRVEYRGFTGWISGEYCCKAGED